MQINIDDLRRAAQRRLPRAIFDFIDGGADDEQTLRANRADFARLTFSPRVLVDVSQRDQSTTLLGTRLESPLVLAPTGQVGLAAPRGELPVARAAAARGVLMAVIVMSNCKLEEIAVASPASKWFQLYVWRDR